MLDNEVLGKNEIANVAFYIQVKRRMGSSGAINL